MQKNTTIKLNKAKIGIVGCGWLGMHLAKHLDANYQLYTTTTSEQKNADLIAKGYTSVVKRFEDYIDLESPSWSVLNTLDAIIITVPFAKRENSVTLKNRFENICSFIGDFNKQLFLMSTIGIYPETEMDMFENSLTNEELNPTLLSVEQLVKSKFPQVNILRLGGLMGGSRLLKNYNVAPSQQIVNHVHYEDICLILEKMIAEKINAKTYNVVAPLHPTKSDVLAYQKGETQTLRSEKFGRIIRSDLVQQELNYTFTHADPRMFE